MKEEILTIYDLVMEGLTIEEAEKSWAIKNPVEAMALIMLKNVTLGVIRSSLTPTNNK